MGSTDGGTPAVSLVRDEAGNLFGTTQYGGDLSCETNAEIHGCGNVFKVGPSGKDTVLHSFTGSPDGSLPLAGLTRDSAGTFYGTTEAGGANGCNDLGCRTVFKLKKSQESILYNFSGEADGRYTQSSLIRDAKGSLYGTTLLGGGNGCGGLGCGIVFRVAQAGKEKALYSFTGGADGGSPTSGLID